MAQIKITITIEATLMRDAHEAVDAMNARLRKSDGHVVRARLTQGPDDRIAAKYDWSPSEPKSNDEIFEWDVFYTEVPTAYNGQEVTTVRAATADEARDIVYQDAKVAIIVQDVRRSGGVS